MKKDFDIPLVKPSLVPWEEIEPLFAEIWNSGALTIGRHTEAFERAAAEVTGAKHVVALSSCTSGMILLLKALGVQGEVILPSFTWASTGHALVWNGIKPVFADCREGDFTLDPGSARAAITDKTSAIFASNVFGVHPDMDALQEVADQAGVLLLCDSAQAIGATYKGRAAGSTALAEVFSLSPTKVVTAVEGGLVTTHDEALSRKIRQKRDYGKSEDGLDIEFFGLSARISEFHSVVGRANLARCRELIESRARMANLYKELLGDIEGIGFQEIPPECESSYNYFVIFVSEQAGDRNMLQEALARRGIQSKRYFYPPLHTQSSYVGLNLPEAHLPVTERASAQGLALPLYSHMEEETVRTVCQAIREELGARPVD